MRNLEEKIQTYVNSSNNKIKVIEQIRNLLFQLSPLKEQPIDNVKWVPLEKVSPNEYNPNQVAKIEMGLLLQSIKHDNYTQPVVTVHDKEKDIYVIVDGFHRYYVMKTNKDIFDRTMGYLPITVINKDINDRMASTVRHNRARGKHTIQGMSKLVFNMLNNGWDDKDICNELGMEPEEILKLKHITGFSKLFKDYEYNKSWQTKNQILLKKGYQDKDKPSRFSSVD